MISRNIKIQGVADVVCVEEYLDTSNLEADQALVQAEASFISTGTELSRVYAHKKGLTYPIYPGYSAIGRIIRAGDGLEGLSQGDRVMYSGAHKEYQLCKMGANSLEMMVKIPEEPDSISASLLHIGLIALNAPAFADIKLGDTVCIYGLGVVGIVAALLCQIAGAHVLGIDAVENRALHAKKAGVQNTVHADAEHQVKAVKDFFANEGGANICIDATGMAPAIQNAVFSTGKHGQVLLLGSPRIDFECNITPMLNHIHMNMIQLVGAFNGRFPFYLKEGDRQCILRNIATMSRLMENGSINAMHIISQVIKPEDIMRAYDGLHYHPHKYHCVAIDWEQSV